MDRVSKIIHLDWAHKRGIYGRGVGVAVVDTGDGVIIRLRHCLEITCEIIWNNL